MNGSCGFEAEGVQVCVCVKNKKNVNGKGAVHKS